MLSALIPISVSGLGIRESIVVYLYYQIGVEPAIVGSVYLMMTFFSYLFSAGVLIYSTKKLKLGREK